MRYYWLQRVDEILEKGEQEWIDNQQTEEVENLKMLLVEAGKRSQKRLTELFGSNMKDWTWGKLHTLTFVSPLRQNGTGRDWLGGGVHPANGSGETLNRGQYDLRGEKGVIKPQNKWIKTVFTSLSNGQNQITLENYDLFLIVGQ